MSFLAPRALQSPHEPQCGSRSESTINVSFAVEDKSFVLITLLVTLVVKFEMKFKEKLKALFGQQMLRSFSSFVRKTCVCFYLLLILI
jgi:hypothetical protein